MTPIQIKLSSAMFRGNNVGVAESAHGDVLIFDPFTPQSKVGSNLLRWDGNDPIIVDLYILEVEDALELFTESKILDYNVQDPEYAGTYEEIKFFSPLQNHAVSFVEYLKEVGLAEIDTDLEAAYAEFLIWQLK